MGNYMKIHVNFKHELPYNYSRIMVAYGCPAEMAENAESFAVKYPWILVAIRGVSKTRSLNLPDPQGHGL